MLEKGSSVNMQQTDVVTVLMWASKEENEEVAGMLFEK